MTKFDVRLSSIQFNIIKIRANCPVFLPLFSLTIPMFNKKDRYPYNNYESNDKIRILPY